MPFQFTYDTNGKAVGVFIPIDEWEKLTAEVKKVEPNKRASGKCATLKSIEKGMREVGQIEKGELKSIPLQQLLDEL